MQTHGHMTHGHIDTWTHAVCTALAAVPRSHSLGYIFNNIHEPTVDIFEYAKASAAAAAPSIMQCNAPAVATVEAAAARQCPISNI